MAGLLSWVVRPRNQSPRKASRTRIAVGGSARSFRGGRSLALARGPEPNQALQPTPAARRLSVVGSPSAAGAAELGRSADSCRGVWRCYTELGRLTTTFWADTLRSTAVGPSSVSPQNTSGECVPVRFCPQAVVGTGSPAEHSVAATWRRSPGKSRREGPVQAGSAKLLNYEVRPTPVAVYGGVIQNWAA